MGAGRRLLSKELSGMACDGGDTDWNAGLELAQVSVLCMAPALFCTVGNRVHEYAAA